MAASNAVQLNNFGITCMPVAFSGKDKDKQKGADNFKPKNGRRSLLPSRKVTLSVINKIKTKYGKLVKITYKLLNELAGIKHTTAWRSLKELEAGDYIKCLGESDYTIKPEFADDEFIVLYDFLLTEELNLGKIVKKLSRNAVIELCNVISFYLNEDNKYKYFIGGDKRTASFLNVAQGTANGIIKELNNVGAIKIHIAHYDSAGNIILKPGKGKSIKEFTVYKVNSKLLTRCRRIQKYYADKREERAKAEQAKQADEKQKQEDKTAQDTAAASDTAATKKPRKKRFTTHKTPPPRSVTGEWAGIFASLSGNSQPPDPFEEFTLHSNKPPTDDK